MWTLLELQFWWERHTVVWGYGTWTNYFPKVLMAFTIGVIENAYKKVAVWLNEFVSVRQLVRLVVLHRLLHAGHGAAEEATGNASHHPSSGG